MTQTTWDEIQRALIAALQSSGLPLGAIHAYPRWAPSWEEFLNLFSVNIEGTEQIRGVEMTRKSVEADWFTFGGSVRRTYRFLLVLHLGLNDAGESSLVLQDLCDRLMDYLDSTELVLPTSYVYGPVVGPVRLADFIETEFHNVLCNHAELEVPVTIAKVV